MRVLLISTYDLGHQPFGIASPAAWLASDGHSVDCVDISVEPLTEEHIRRADVAALYLPMHTATRLAVPVLERIRRLNPRVRLCCFGLYAPLNEDLLRGLGVEAIIGGEFEAELRRFARGGSPGTLISLEKLNFLVPDRSGLPQLERYSSLRVGKERRLTGYVEASRGCKHLCRHCPIVPVYKGAFRVVPREIVLADIRNQVAAGARHITFGDPDFFNGPAHATRLVEALHAEFPDLTYDATIKIEHLRQRRDLLPVLKGTGCLFVISAVESLDDAVLAKLDKGHTRRDFEETVEDFRRTGLTLAPTFIAFTPWTTLRSYRDLLKALQSLGLVAAVSPVQLALRLLIPNESRLLELPEIQSAITGFDERALLHRWRHADPSVDELAAAVLKLVHREQKRSAGRPAIFRRVWELAEVDVPLPENFDLIPRAAVPYLDEPWYC
ncbi:MAG TPA: CUAEP/CCAEP-tail radical SAM protein [Bryobacteraceae bacterium]|nr:CUAEP/CCAEP-tail radical SAM protein [Bryobacteraceae bacterium]